MSLPASPLQGLVIENVETWAPEPLGRVTLVLGGGRILAVLEPGAAAPALPGFGRIDGRHLRALPGLIDQHVHFLGGGDANGALGRVDELHARAFLSAGITSAVGLLGVDEDTRTLRLLLRKAHELRAEGISAWFYTGGMRQPAAHLLDSVTADVSFLDQVIGAKTAIAEKLHPNRNWADLADLAGQLMRARAMSGKASVLHCHVGDLPEALAPLERLVTELGMPRGQIMPTHVNRTPDFSPVFAQAIDFARKGGTIDLTVCVSRTDGNLTGIDTPDALRSCLDAGVPLERITLSTDGNIPHALRDASGALTGMGVVPPSVLWRDFWRLQHEAGLSLTDALRPVTTNVAGFLGLGHRKGRIRAGHDADLVLIDAGNRIDTVIAGGQIAHRAEG